MYLKPRPISEAPKNQWLLTRRREGQNVVFEARWYRPENQLSDVYGTEFWTTEHLLRAAEILAAITPEGYELTGEHRTAERGEYWLFYNGARFEAVSGPGTDFCSFLLRKLPPPVQYEFVCEEKPRECVVGDWVYGDHFGFIEVNDDNLYKSSQSSRLCFRRVEVKP